MLPPDIRGEMVALRGRAGLTQEVATELRQFLKENPADYNAFESCSAEELSRFSEGVQQFLRRYTKN